MIKKKEYKNQNQKFNYYYYHSLFFIYFFKYIANDISIWIGRLARLLSEDSKELPKSLSFTAEENEIFELKSGVGKGKYIYKLIV